MRGRCSPDEEEFREGFGRRVRTVREALGLTQEEFAELVFLHPKYLGAIERGKHTASIWTAAKIAVGTGKEAGALMEGLRPFADHPTRPAPT